MSCVMALVCVDKCLYLSAQWGAVSLCDIPFEAHTDAWGAQSL